MLKLLALDTVARTIRPGIFSYQMKVPAGMPSPAMDHSGERIDLNKEFIKHPSSTFIIDCEGFSMINAFIPPKAKLIIDRSLHPQNGDIILAVINGEFTVKFLKKNKYRCWLCPANSKFPEIEITDEMNMEVWGVVTYIITNVNDVKSSMR